VKQAAEQAQAYFIQRELMGMRDHSHPTEHYKIPNEVLAQIGVK